MTQSGKVRWSKPVGVRALLLVPAWLVGLLLLMPVSRCFGLATPDAWHHLGSVLVAVSVSTPDVKVAYAAFLCVLVPCVTGALHLFLGLFSRRTVQLFYVAVIMSPVVSVILVHAAHLVFKTSFVLGTEVGYGKEDWSMLATVLIMVAFALIIIAGGVGLWRLYFRQPVPGERSETNAVPTSSSPSTNAPAAPPPKP